MQYQRVRGQGGRQGREGGSAAASGLQAELLCGAGEEKAFFICEAECLIPTCDTQNAPVMSSSGTGAILPPRYCQLRQRGNLLCWGQTHQPQFQLM